MYRLIFNDASPKREPLEISELVLVIGRDTDCGLRLIQKGVTNRHAALERRPDGYFVRALGKSNSLRVNGAPTQEQRLSTGDELEIGSVRMRFEVMYPPVGTRRPLDLMQFLAGTIVAVLIAGQIGLFGWLFSQEHPRKVRLDTRQSAGQATSPATQPAVTGELPGLIDDTPLLIQPPVAPRPPAVLDRMIKVVRVERTEAADSVSLKIQVKAQVGERELDASAVAVGLQFFGPGTKPGEMIEKQRLWLTVPARWENFSTQSFSRRYYAPPQQFAGYIARTYYRKKLQDVRAEPMSLLANAPVMEP
jgi:hypothetical protein